MSARPLKLQPYFVEKQGLWKVAVELPPTPSNPRRRKVVSARTATDARRKAQQVKRLHEAGMSFDHRFRDVAAFLGWWESAVLPGTVSRSTEITYGNALRLWVIPHVGRRKLDQLSPADVTMMLRELHTEGRSANTRSLARRVLARALRRAEQEGWVVRNVARLADGPKIDDERRGRSLTVVEAKKLLAATNDHRLAGPIIVQLALGLRRGEVLGLSWDAVCLDGIRPTLQVRRQLVRLRGEGLVVKPVPKTKKSRRTLVLPGPVVTVLAAQRGREAADKDRVGNAWVNEGNLVFTTPIGTPLDPDRYRHQVTALAESAGIGKLTTHHLRHSNGSFLYALGVPMRTISESLGHANTRVTEDVYVHLQDEASDDVAQRIGGLLW